MIYTVARISLLRLWHNKGELLLTFVVPILFFSIFAMIFGSRDRGGSTPRIKVALVNESQVASAKYAIEQLQEQKSLRFFSSPTQTTEDAVIVPVGRDTAERLVREGVISAAIILIKNPESDANKGSLELDAEVVSDSFDQVASQVIAALVQKAILASAASQPPQPVAMDSTAPAGDQSVRLHVSDRPVPAGTAPAIGSKPVEPKNGNSTELQAPASSAPPESLADTQSGPPAPGIHSIPGPPPASGTPGPGAVAMPSFASLAPPEIKVIDLLGAGKVNPVISMYAAGIAVMFLLFSVTGASGSLLEEQESSTLERLLTSRLTMDQLLMGKWIYLVGLGVTQTTLMFIWGQIVFGVDLIHHLDGFIIMTMVTSGAASSFALFLASLCRSRAQLNWVSIVVILGMSALGGSMVPRYLMGEDIQRLGLLTFNAWALDGYNKVFWRDLPASELWPQLLFLGLAGLVFIILARVIAVRWERV